MKIIYIYRHPAHGYSIGKVFRPIEEEMNKYAQVSSIYLPVPNYSFKGLWTNIRYVQKHLKNNKYDIVHITGTEHYLLPFLIGHKVVITIHDLGRLLNLNGIRWWRYWLMQVAVLKLAKAITCISSKTLNEIQKSITIKKGRMVVIPNPIDHKYSFSHKVFNTECPTILHIGIKPNKNLIRSIMALKEIKCKLRIVGKVNKSDIDLLQTKNLDYSSIYDLTDEEIIQEYQNADIINFPSYYEGFGMPIIEGQAIGRLVITSNIEPMVSVAGDGAILCNPFDVESIRNAYLKGINDKNYRDNIIKRGVENVKKYSLESITKQYFQLYKRVLNVSN